MIHSHSLARIALSATLVLAATATTRPCKAWDPFGIQDTNEYMPFGPYGPKLTIGTPSPTKIRNGGNFNKKNRTASRHNTVAQRTVAQSRSVSQNYRVAAARTTRFDELNLSVTTPAGPWFKLDPQKTGSHACLLLTRTNPAIMISLAGEAVGVEADETNDSLLAASQTKMRSLPGIEIDPNVRPQSAAHIEGLAYQATVTQGDQTAYYTIWVAAHHGYTYKLAVYGDHLHKRMIDEAMQNVLNGLQPIPPNHVAQRSVNKKTIAR
jgi:hypothetical protein